MQTATAPHCINLGQKPPKPRQAKDSNNAAGIASYFHDAIKLKMRYNSSNYLDKSSKTDRVTNQKIANSSPWPCLPFLEKLLLCASHYCSSGIPAKSMSRLTDMSGPIPEPQRQFGSRAEVIYDKRSTRLKIL